jgi:hypothetical protein
MKNLKLSLMILLVTGIAACSKTNNSQVSDSSAPADQAAILVANSVAVNSNGAFNVTDGLVIDAQAKVSIDTLCGTTWVDSASTTNPQGSQTTYSYKSKYIYKLNCDSANTFSGSVTSTLTYSGSLNGPNLTSTNSGSSVFTVTGLGKTSSTYTINGEYKRAGSFTSKPNANYSGTNNVDIVVTNLVLTKTSRSIKSGTATVTVSATTAKEGTFSYNGIIVFNDDNTATLTLNGNVYLINNTTGLVTRH